MKYNIYPSQIHIEATYGCPSQCWFCYKQVLTKNPLNPSFLTTETFKNILKSIEKHEWHDTIIKFALRGEPTLNPYLETFLKMIKNREMLNPSAIISNSKFLTVNRIKRLFDAGLNYLIVDCYTNEKEFKEYLKKDNSLPDIIDFYEDKIRLYEVVNNKDKFIIILSDIEKHNGEVIERCFNNHAGNIIEENFRKKNIQLKNTPIQKGCNRPFRELAILHDGSVLQCCEDGGSEYPLGNVNNSDLYDIWHKNKSLQIIRDNLNKGNRKDINLCSKCDYNGS